MVPEEGRPPRMSPLARSVAAMLVASTCPLCASPGPAPCDACLAELPPAHHPPRVPGLDSLRVLFAYEGPTRRLVAALKYRNARRVVPRLAAELAGVVAHRPDVVTWVPAAPANRRRRGYDQGEVLGRRLARRLGVPAVRLLARRGGAQTSSTREERLTGPILAVRAAVHGSVLVVDDVVTSGASLTAAAAGLRGAGAGRVDAVVVAARPEWTFGISKAGASRRNIR